MTSPAEHEQLLSELLVLASFLTGVGAVALTEAEWSDEFERYQRLLAQVSEAAGRLIPALYYHDLNRRVKG